MAVNPFFLDRIDGAITSVAIKAPVMCATTGQNITLSGLQTIDGYTTLAGDRVLVKDQSDTTTNGIYIAAALTWNRDVDFSGARDAVQGTICTVFQGAVNGTTAWYVSSPNPIFIDGQIPSNITFAVFINFGNPLVATSSTSNTIGTGNLSFTTQAGKAFGPGTSAVIASAANPTVNYMGGIISAYNSETGALTFDSEVADGSGTHTDWVITISGATGPQGATGATGPQGPSGALSNGTYGDIVVTSSGAVLTVGAAAITSSKIASSVALAGAPTTSTASPGDNTTKIATTAFVEAALSGATSSGSLLQIDIIETSGTWNKPAGANSFEIEGWGAGASGTDPSGSVTQNNGGNTSFGSHFTAGGGQCGTSGTPFVGGIASGGNIFIPGQSGLPGYSAVGSSQLIYGSGADSPRGMGLGAKGALGYGSGVVSNATGYGSGGGSPVINVTFGNPPGGASGGYCYLRATSGIGSTETVTIGAAGTSNGGASYSGTQGIVIIRSYS